MGNVNNQKRTLLSVLKSKKVIVCVIIFAFIAISLAGSIIQYKLCGTTSKPLYLEVLCYSTQIVSSLFVTGGVIIAVWQYYLSSKSAKTDLEIIQVQRAVDLSEYYKDNILRFSPAIHYIFDNTGIREILDKINPEDLEHFDEIEIQKFLSPEEITKLDRLTKTDDFVLVFLKANYIYNLGFNLSVNSLFHKLRAENDDNNIASNIDKEAIWTFVGDLFCDVLNNMEFFAMHFSHRTADESVVYQSLHQTYLQLVHLLCFKIARVNKASATKYYTNVIWLYKKWLSRKLEQDTNFLNGVRNLTTNGTIINN